MLVWRSLPLYLPHSHHLASGLCLWENPTANQRAFSSNQLGKNKDHILMKANDDSGEFGLTKDATASLRGQVNANTCLRASEPADNKSLMRGLSC